MKNILLLASLLFSLSGCMTSQFVPAANQSLPPAPAGQAQIIFLSPSSALQVPVPVGIFKIDGTQRTHLASAGPTSKAVVLLPPGKHTLMSNFSGLHAHVLEANVEAGKRYYVLLRYVYLNGLQMRPIRTSGASDYSTSNKNFRVWLSATQLVEQTPESGKIFEESNKEALPRSQAAAWRSWQAKTPAERAELTLTPEDAIAY